MEQKRPVNRGLPQRPLKLMLAVVLIVLGIAGLVLPFLQGILFLAIGLVLLADVVPSLGRFLHRMEQKDDRAARISKAARRGIDALFERQWLVLSILAVALGLIVWGIYLLLF